ncbi:MAG: right-handed parallel beta-helix repeat-containing protein [Lachnospiraceae bacterium]|nr:right-handed parallel beta-helix repeat-containing protein [Lachnospiraceae bacterium]
MVSRKRFLAVMMSLILLFSSLAGAVPAWAADDDGTDPLPEEYVVSEDAAVSENEGGTDAEPGDGDPEDASGAESASENDAEAVSGNESVSENEGGENLPGEVLPGDEGDGHLSENIWVTTIDDSGFVYTGTAICPEVRVYDGEELLQEKRDYTVSYRNNTKAYVIEDREYPSATDIEKAPQVVVSMKGSYGGQTQSFFSIRPLGINESGFSLPDITLAYTGKQLKCKPSLCWQGKMLKAGTDYVFGTLQADGSLKDLTVEQLTGVSGTDTVTVVTAEGKKGSCFTGRRSCRFVISGASGAVAMDKVKVSAVPAQDYTGAPIRTDQFTKNGKPFALTVKDGKYELVPGKDYEILEAEGAVLPGKYRFILRGLADHSGERAYIGEKAVEFTIKAIPIGKAEVCGLPGSVTYAPGSETAHPDEKAIVLRLDGKEIGRDQYRISYKNDKKAGKATITFEGCNGYSGKKSVGYRIEARSVNESSVTVSVKDCVYQKGGAKPLVTVKDRGILLREGTDYVLSYSDNKAVSAGAKKAPKVTVSGKGFYSDKRSTEFAITSAPFSATAGIVMRAYDKPANGKAGAYVTKIQICDAEGTLLKAGTDYEKEIIYKDAGGNILDKSHIASEGEVITAVATGKGNYQNGSVSATFRILPSGTDISKAKVTAPSVYYAGYGKKNEFPENATVKLNGTSLERLAEGESGDGYVVLGNSYKKNDRVGTASVMIHGVGTYGGYKTVKFKILSKTAKGAKAVRHIPKPEKCLDVTELGVIPDDGIDDSDAINAAIATAAENGDCDHTLYFPEGRYDIAKGILLDKDGVQLVLDGKAVLHVAARSGEGYNVILIRADRAGIRGGELSGERYRHAGGANGQYGMGISIDRGANVTIRDMIIHSNRGDGIYLNDGGSGRVHDMLIRDCEIYGNSRNNVCVSRADNTTIENCRIYGADGHSPMSGIDLEPDSGESFKGVRIKNCEISSWEKRGCFEKGGLWCNFAILINSAGHSVTDVTIEGCTLNGDLAKGDCEPSLINTKINGEVY